MQRAAIGRAFRHQPEKSKPDGEPSAKNDKKAKTDSVKSSSENKPGSRTNSSKSSSDDKTNSKGKTSSEKRSNLPKDPSKESSKDSFKNVSDEEKERRRIGAKPVPAEKKPLDPEWAQKCLEIEKRILQASFCLGLLATFLFFLAVVTVNWVRIDMSMIFPTNETDKVPFTYRLSHYHGLWNVECEYKYNKSAINVNQLQSNDQQYCGGLFAQKPDPAIMHFRRSCCAIGIVALVVSIFANVGSWYSIRSLRYIYKRLAGILHFITGACCWITVEVFKQSVQYEQTHSEKQMHLRYGFSYYLGWISFSFFLLVGLVLLICSRKRKGDQARCPLEAAENEPVNIGRI